MTMNRDPRGYYAALRVSPDATAAQIRHAFRALMRLRHPDVELSAGSGQGDVYGAGEARRILEAFAVLRDPKSRAEYDPDAGGAGPGSGGTGSRDIPVRLHRNPQPLFRATPVRWERGPY
ncbi:J domain-containing protein [Arthrobacter sp. U41]|uniref:J domain-containing protein n=1 Tax=Arthrobacter sp. U41 TaxID=1849032 RepID=UPI0011A7228A|nr:J domain-containing protein [Arthrobacter sp. U41]